MLIIVCFMWISFEEVLVPIGFKAVSVEENPHAIPTRKVQ